MLSKETEKEYYTRKRSEVLAELKPLLNGFCKLKEGEDYDYIVIYSEKTETQKERVIREYLEIKDQKIGCRGNSIDGVVKEALGWVIAEIYVMLPSGWLGPFQNQTLKEIKRYWIG